MDDAWKDGYDAWKLASPDDDYDEDECCPHDDFDIDWNGLACCSCCQLVWRASPAEIQAQERHQREYAEWLDEQYRRERWLKLTAPFRWLWYRVWMPVSPRTAIRSLDDSEIPF